MFVRARRVLSLVVGSLVAVACDNSGPTPPIVSEASAIAIVAGNGQVDLVGQTLRDPLVVQVTSATLPVAGISVTFTVVSGSATVSPATTTTNAAGRAQTQVTLGSTPGTASITASIPNTTLTTTFVVSAGSGQQTIACQGASAVTPAVGDVDAGLAGEGICVGGGATGAEYALVAFNSDPNSATGSSLPVIVSSVGASGVASASIAPSLSVVPDRGARLVTLQPTGLRAQFDARLREIARRQLGPMVPAAQARLRARSSFAGPSFVKIPGNPAVGTLIQLNANETDPCANPDTVTARVAAVSSTAIIVADTANPPGGFTDAEYLAFATMFDTLINPLDVSAFGAPTDIDGNSKIVIFFTKEVNKLTPKGANGVIGGFFFERDLFPAADSAAYQGCAGSNGAEMFYLLVPDPNSVYGDPRTKDRVLDLTPGTLAHEYQHLINAGRRMYVNLPFNTFEDVWLNEGLSHAAEELLYLHVAGLTPRQNIGIATITANQASVDAFNAYQGDNSGRFHRFLEKPTETSVYADNDSLETRGATWYLLRYLVDHRGTGDGDAWSQLVNTSLAGHANLAHVFGGDYMTQIRDWATAVFADDVPGVTDQRFLEPTWNMRDIFPQLRSNGVPLGKYPLAVVPLADAAPASLDLWSGGVAYLRFSVPTGSQASIDWSAGSLPVSPLVQFTLVRTK